MYTPKKSSTSTTIIDRNQAVFFVSPNHLKKTSVKCTIVDINEYWFMSNKVLKRQQYHVSKLNNYCTPEIQKGLHFISKFIRISPLPWGPSLGNDIMNLGVRGSAGVHLNENSERNVLIVLVKNSTHENFKQRRNPHFNMNNNIQLISKI